MKLWLIVAYLIFAQQECKRNRTIKHDDHVVFYVIKQTDQFQKFGKTLARKYDFLIK